MNKRLFLILLGCILSVVVACAQTSTYTFHFENISIEEALYQIEKETDYSFLYNKAVVDVSTRINQHVNNKTIKDMLDIILLSHGISYIIWGKQVVLNKAEGQPPSRQEMIRISGTITTSYGEEAIGANIIQKGTSNGTITGLDGDFILEVPIGSEIVVSYLGYKSVSFKVIPSKTHYRIVLTESLQYLNEVVVIGYGMQPKKLVTGSTVKVTGEEIQRLNTPNIYNALQSQTPGVSIIQNSGMPGSGYNVIIRGIGTNGNASPLIVIDGVAGASLSSLMPSDIESVDILKDAASAAIYGSRAANGVILITTRQGRAGKTQVSYDFYQGYQNIAKGVNLLNATQYMEIMNLIAEADGTTTFDYGYLMPKQYEAISNGRWNGTNWFNEATLKNAPIQNHALNITSGNDNYRLSMGGSIISQDGIIGKPSIPHYNRYNFRINTETTLLRHNERLLWKIGENLHYSYNTRNGNLSVGNQYSSDIRNLLVANPLLPAYNENGDFYIYEDMNKDAWVVDNAMANPLALLDLVRHNSLWKGYNMQGSIYTDFFFLENLVFRSIFGYKMSSSSYRSYIPAYKIADKAENVTDDVTQEISTGWSWTSDNTLNYKFTTVNSEIDLLGGISFEKWGYGETLRTKNSNSLFPGSYKHAWINNTQGISPEETTISGYPWSAGSLASFFGRINYSYLQTYLLTAVLRADGSSMFALGHQWGYFPSLSTGWILSNEPFLSDHINRNWLNELKIRVSWGQNGNSNIDNFQYLATISFDESEGYYFNDDKRNLHTGAYPNILPNTDLSWETSEQVNIGLDGVFLSNRLNFQFDIYQKTTKDWLVKAPALTSFGTGAPMINGGDIRNTGIELLLHWKDQAGGFAYSGDFNLSKNINKVTRLANNEGIIYGPDNILSQNTARLYQAKVGYPIGYFYGYKTNGIFQNQAEIEAMNGVVLQSNPVPGDVRFVDLNGDGKIDLDDKTMIGNPHPDIQIGFDFKMTYKGFDLGISGSGAFGQQIAKSYRAFASVLQENYTTDVYNYWKGEGSSYTHPRLTSGRHPNWKEISDLLLENGDYVKIRNITFGYDFRRLFPKLPLEQLRFYFTIQNAFTFSSYSGMDPEIGYGGSDSWSAGIDLGFYPSPRTHLFGLSIKL